jgi:hypothetical protein
VDIGLGQNGRSWPSLHGNGWNGWEWMGMKQSVQGYEPEWTGLGRVGPERTGLNQDGLGLDQSE